MLCASAAHRWWWMRASQFLIGLWRGGTPIGICVEEFFRVQVRACSLI